MNKQKTYTQSELNRKEIIDYIKDGKIFPKLVAHIHGYHSGCQFYHIGNLDREAKECFDKYYEREDNKLWTDDYTLLVLDYDVTDEYPYGFGFMGVVEWFEMEFEDEDRKEELLDIILDRDEFDIEGCVRLYNEFIDEFKTDVKNSDYSDTIIGDYIYDFCDGIVDCDEEEQTVVREYIMDNLDVANILGFNGYLGDFNITFGALNNIIGEVRINE